MAHALTGYRHSICCGSLDLFDAALRFSRMREEQVQPDAVSYRTD